MDHAAIIGTAFQFAYSDETYEIEVLTENQLRWTRIKGEDIGTTDLEHYVFSQLSDDIVMLTWIEADGLGLSNVLNYAASTVTTHANMGREVFRNPGKLVLAS